MMSEPVPAYPELAGKRVLITGLTRSCGVDIARAFAEHKGRLVLQFAEESEATETMAEIAAPVGAGDQGVRADRRGGRCRDALRAGGGAGASAGSTW